MTPEQRREHRLQRSLARWAGTKPAAIPGCSPAHIMFLVEDAKKDIASLAAENERLRAERDDARAAWGNLNAALTPALTTTTARVAGLEAENERLQAAFVVLREEKDRVTLSDMENFYARNHERCRAETAEAALAAAQAKLAETEAENGRLRAERDEAQEAHRYAAKNGLAQMKAGSAAREDRDRLAALLRPIQRYAAVAFRPEIDIGDGEIGEVYHGGLRHSLHTRDLRAIRDAVLPPAPTAHQGDDHAR